MLSAIRIYTLAAKFLAISKALISHWQLISGNS
jgi:hypothetical protein